MWDRLDFSLTFMEIFIILTIKFAVLMAFLTYRCKIAPYGTKTTPAY